MPEAWRIVRDKYAATPFDGEGAYRHGGRWNSAGVHVVYASSTLSLAALEILVHLNPFVSLRYVRFRISFDESLVKRIPPETLPAGWRDSPPGPASMTIGDNWVSEARTPVLQIPSGIIPDEFNCLLNPLHPDFRKIKIGKAEPFTFDPRLLP